MLLSEVLWTIPIFSWTVDRFRDAPCYSVSFDECMNKISQNEQMDFIVRYWDSDTGQDTVWGTSGPSFLAMPQRPIFWRISKMV